MSKKIGLIAGWGRFPIIVARRLHESGYEVYCMGIHNHADPELKQICHKYIPVGVCRAGKQIRFLKRYGVVRATMAGKIFKTIMFEKFAWIKQLPDLTFLRFFYKQLISRTANCSDDSMLLTFVRTYRNYGIQFAPATDFAPELLVKHGVLTHRSLSDFQQRDIEFAWSLAKKMGRLDVGQSVAVKRRAVLAVEAVEGTNECIRRAGTLCRSGGFTVVKVAKPQQDMRFDVPTIGVGTLQTMRDAGGSVLAVEADKTIILDQAELIAYANRHKISVIAIDPQSMSAEHAA